MPDIDDDATNTPNPGDLRKALDKANQTIRELQAKARKADLNEVLQGLGKPAKVAKLIPSEVEATEEAVKAWLKDFDDVFVGSASATPPTTGEPAASDEPTAPSVPTDYVAAMTAAANAASTGTTIAPDPNGLATKLSDLAAKNLPWAEFQREFTALQHNTKG